MIAAIDWTDVLVGVALAVGLSVGPVICAWIVYLLRADVRVVREALQVLHHEVATPSGDPIGQVVERTLDLSATNSAHLTKQAQAAARTDEELSKVHLLVNDRLDRALALIDDLKKALQAERGKRASDR